MAIRIIESKLNPRIKELRGALRQTRATPSGLVGLEGVHLLAEALQSGIELRTIFVAQGHEKILSDPPLAEFHLIDSFEVLAVPREGLNLAATTETPQPVAALAQIRTWKWPDLIPAQRSAIQPLVVVVSGVQDPGNLGTILRSSEAFGATGVICLPGTVSPWNPKTMRASAGSVFRIPLISASAAYCFERLREAGVPALAAMAHDAQPLGEINLSEPVALVIGSEGSGLAPEVADQCDARITIPCPGPVESLNAAVAASVLLYEASRQRALTLAAPASKTQRRP